MEEKNRIEDEVKRSIEHEPVPESLRPERIEKMLEMRGRRKFPYRRLGAAAASAALVLAAGAVILAWQPWKHSGGEGQAAAGKGSTEAETDISNPLPEGVTTARNYEQVFELLDKNNTFEIMEEKTLGGSVEEGASYGTADEETLVGTLEEEASYKAAGDTGVAEQNAEYAAGEGNSGDVVSAEQDYSTVNAQEEGVEEADIMVTDGEWLYLAYTADRNRIAIVAPDKETGKSEQVSAISLEDNIYVQEMYIRQGQLIVIAQEQQYEYQEGETSLLGRIGGMFGGREENDYVCIDRSSTLAITYNVSDRSNPVESGRVKADGYYEASRMVDGYLYFFSQYNQFYAAEGCDSEDYIPCVQDACIPPGRIFIPDTDCAQGYLVGVSVDLREPDQACDQFAMMMYGSEYYISRQNIYVAQENDRLQIVRFSYSHGEISAEASGEVDGWLNDNFSMDEYNGYLRVVTTSWEERRTEEVNNLYVLDASLKQAGRIENLAPGEQIYSARFMGGVGYFVTYRQVDPLFSVDLSDPYHPKVLGELKVSGFSEYLHPYGEGRLLGIGWETSVTEYGGTTRDGMKLSMFDTSNPGNVSELGRLVEEQVTGSSAQYNYHAILINEKKNIFGFAVEVMHDSQTAGRGSGTHYYTYRYTEGKGFERVTDTQMEGAWNYENIRAAYIGDILYITDGTQVCSVSLADGKVLDKLTLN